MGIRMSEIIVFRLETCPNCDRLVELLRENGIEIRVVVDGDPPPGHDNDADAWHN